MLSSPDQKRDVLASRDVPLPLGITVSTAAAAVDKRLSGVVSMVTTSVSFEVGVEWGDGILTLADGKQYRFRVRGIQAGSVGIGKTLSHGRVYHLHKIRDFSGIYGAIEADVALMAGAGGVAMRNAHGVVMYLSSVEEGMQLTLAAEGVEIQLKDEP
jgi:hypothetical protein